MVKDPLGSTAVTLFFIVIKWSFWHIFLIRFCLEFSQDEYSSKPHPSLEIFLFWGNFPHDQSAPSSPTGSLLYPITEIATLPLLDRKPLTSEHLGKETLFRYWHFEWFALMWVNSESNTERRTRKWMVQR